jgi:hypothetical protein
MWETRSLLVYVLTGLEFLDQPAQIVFLALRSCRQRQFHLFCCVIELALRRIDAGQSRMYEPQVGMFLRILAEDCKGLFATLLALQLTSV